MKIKQPAKLEAAIHFITAIVLLLKGYDKLSTGSHVSGFIIFSFGIIILLITFLDRTLKISHLRTKWIVYLIEAIAFLIIASLYFKENKVYLPYVYLVPSLIFFVMAGIAIIKEYNQPNNG